MLVIIEGCDGAGKTTFAERLALLGNDFGAVTTILHKGPPEGDPFTEYTEGLAFYTPSLEHKHLVICDRWHLGELVYGPVYRGGSKLTRDQAIAVEQLLNRLGAVKVFLDAPDHVLRTRAFHDRGEDFLKQGDLVHVASHYRTLVTGLMGWYRVDTSEDSTRAARRTFRRALLREGDAALVYPEKEAYLA